MDHFLTPNNEPSRRIMRYFGCYHPANYQSRALTTNYREPHGVFEAENMEPDLDLVLKQYWSFDWVALTEFFHESKCLLYFRILGKDRIHKASIDHDLIRGYLEKSCRCSSSNMKHDDIHFTHNNTERRSSLLNLPSSMLHKIDALTQADTALYKTALKQFLKEIVWMESQLGRRVICDDVLLEQTKELAYLDLNVLDLYLAFLERS